MNKFEKNIMYYLILLAITSCSDKNSWDVGSFIPSLKANFIYFPHSQIELGGSCNVRATYELQAVNTPWKFSNPASGWLEVSPMEGIGDATITFTAKENPTSDNIRTAVLSLQSVDNNYIFSHSLIVNQSTAIAELTPSEKAIVVSRESQTKNITISANTSWTAICSEDWIHLTKVSDTLLDIVVDENNDLTERNAVIILKGSKTTEVHITQRGISITLSQSNVEFSREAQTKNIAIESNVSWTASCDVNWIHLTSSPEKGTIYIAVDANNGTTDRFGIIKLSNSDLSIKVIQHGYIFEELISEIDFTPHASYKVLDIITDGNWTASSNESWISVKPSSGIGNAQFSIYVDSNTSADMRKGTISVTVGDVTKFISVQQEGVYINISSSYDSLIPSYGGSRNLSFVTSESWTIDCKNSSWVYIDKTKGEAGANTVLFNFSPNCQKEERRDTTYIRTGNANLQDLRIISVQSGMYLYLVSSPDPEIAANGGNYTITFTSSDEWSIDTNSPSWISLDKYVGPSGANSINISLAPNDDYEARTSTIVIISKNPYQDNLRIKITQNGQIAPKENEHEYVDLGLTSKNLWARCNVGASSYYDYGDLYAWGETKTKIDYSSSNYTYTDNPAKLPLDKDAAHCNWGGRWRMPTQEEFEELYRECDWTWVTINGINGFKVTSKKNSRYIFLPAAGYGFGPRSYAGLYGTYWASTIYIAIPDYVYNFGFGYDNVIGQSLSFSRSVGRSVRPVFRK